MFAKAKAMSQELWEPGKILLVDDSASSRHFIKQHLVTLGHKVVEASDGAKGLWQLQDQGNVELVLCDLEMPLLDGMGFLRALRARGDQPPLPVLMISVVREGGRVAEVLEAGATDFIRKPIFPAELIVRVRNSLALYRTMKNLAVIAVTDGLTQLYNQSKFFELLEEEMERTRRYQRPLAVIFSDLDKFKSVNDTYGHKVGDEVLAEFSRRLKDNTRRYDQVGRYGGEEFVVLAPETDMPQASNLAERIRTSMHRSVATSRGPLKVTTSLGVATFDGRGPRESAAQLVSRADQALYQAKELGRNRVVVCP